jgi:DNA-binding NtrC family response regulator
VVEVARASLDFVRCSSLEELTARLCRASVELFPCSGAAVYLTRRGRLVRQAEHPSDAGFQRRVGTPSALAALSEASELHSDPPWGGCGPGESVLVAPLGGRHRRVGFLALDVSSPATHWSDLLTLLAAFAGVVIEEFLFEDRRQSLTAPVQSPRFLEATQSLGVSPAMTKVRALLSRLAQVDSPVLLTGETGTGKSLAARALHDAGPRRNGPFVTLNCAAIPDALVESELFGHEAGAFSGALKLHRGRVEQAQGGTLFLDEIGELPLLTQPKLLNFLEDRTYVRVGGEAELRADVRIISASNSDLDLAVAEQTFRRDLLYRLNVFTLQLPPLRARGRDVLALAETFAVECSQRCGVEVPTFDSAIQEQLLAHSWPGNVRELKNVIERAVILAEEDLPWEFVLAGTASLTELDDLAEPDLAEPDLAATTPADQQHLSPTLLGGDSTFVEAKARVVEEWESAYLTALLQSTAGNVSEAARSVRMDKKNLRRKIKRHGIDLNELRTSEGGGSYAPPRRAT